MLFILHLATILILIHTFPIIDKIYRKLRFLLIFSSLFSPIPPFLIPTIALPKPARYRVYPCENIQKLLIICIIVQFPSPQFKVRLEMNFEKQKLQLRKELEERTAELEDHKASTQKRVRLSTCDISRKMRVIWNTLASSFSMPHMLVPL